MGLIIIDLAQLEGSLSFDMWSINNVIIGIETLPIYVKGFKSFKESMGSCDSNRLVMKLGLLDVPTQFPILRVTFDGADSLIVVNLSQSC
mgnify:CR=1 FL=1